jgi:hypothetical protein
MWMAGADTSANAQLVTHYDIGSMNVVPNGTPVTILRDLSGYNNHAGANINRSATYISTGIGGKPSLQFSSVNQYQSGFTLGTVFGISGDAAFTVFYVFRAPSDPSSVRWIGGLGTGAIPNGGVLLEIETNRLDVATGHHNDVTSTNNSFASLADKDLVVSIVHQGPTGQSISNTTQMYINGIYFNNSTTGNAATTALNLADAPFTLGINDGFSGLFAEAMVYNVALNPATRMAVEQQLMTEYSMLPIPEPSLAMAMVVFGCIGVTLRRLR